MARCFLALDLGPQALRAAEDAHRYLDTEDVRKVPPSSLHMTIKFLGEVSLVDVGRPLVAALAPSVSTALPLLGEARIDGFPSAEDARVIVLSCSDPKGDIARLAAVAEDAAERFGVAREARAFHPHVTLGRSKAFDVRNIAKRFALRPLGQATRLTLYETQGSSYIVRA